MRATRTGSEMKVARAVVLATMAALMACSRATETAQPVLDAATAAREIAAQLEKDCAALTGARVANVTIKSAAPHDSGATGPAACRVEGVIDGSIGFELLLPHQWNGKFLMGGGGGYMGSLANLAQMPEMTMGRPALERGYATASTDSGHQGNFADAEWALGNPQARENFAHRAVHRTAEVSKQIIGTYYPKELAGSYFFGCSRGGGHGLMLAQRYPQDFDGIVAGAPAFDWTGMMVEFLQNQQAVFPDPAAAKSPVITADNRKLLADTLLESCDAQDGATDGIIGDPRECKFDLGTLPRCSETRTTGCVTRRQLAAIRIVYADALIGEERIYPGPPFGGENDAGGWDVWMTSPATGPLQPGLPNLHFAFGLQFARNFVFEDPNWTYVGYDFADWPGRTAELAKLLNATDPDLRKFRDRGGKLILWHGWSDSALPATRTVEYYEAAAKVDPGLDSYARLFMMPGVGHCGGGPGPDRADWIGVLEQWVEKRTAPEEVTARRLDSAGATLAEGRLCAWPRRAQLLSDGDARSVSGWHCAE